ncbi:MAG: response regulator transcription factor [Bacteroidales bacterium]|jgi:DNA-binding NarL/FixJ family response regulator
MIRVFIIEDHHWITDGLKYDFRPTRDEIEIIGSSTTIAKAIDNLQPNEFDLIILDLWLGDSDPSDNLRKLQIKFPDKPIVIFTYEESPLWKQKMYNAGVKAYLLKAISKKELKNALIKVVNGETVFPDLSFLKVNITGESLQTAQKLILKPSEKEAFLLLSRGMNQKAIADHQNKSQSSVEKAMRKVRKQFNVNSNSEVIHILTQLKDI